jgi:hypothetical protein
MIFQLQLEILTTVIEKERNSKWDVENELGHELLLELKQKRVGYETLGRIGEMNSKWFCKFWTAA